MGFRLEPFHLYSYTIVVIILPLLIQQISINITKKKKIVHPIVNHLTRRLQGILTPFNSLNSEKLDCLDSEIMFHTSNTVEFLLLHTFSPEVKQIVFIRPEHILSNGTAVHTPTHPPTYPQNRQEQSIASSKYSVVAIFLFRVTKHNKIIQILFII